MAAVGEVFLLPRIDMADYSAFRAVLNGEQRGTSLPILYDEWLVLLAARRRERTEAGLVVREVPISVLQFAAYCESQEIKKPTVLTLDRFIAEVSQH